MNPKSSTTWKFLAPNPKSIYKQLFLKGRRIRARDLYGMYMSAEEPMTPAQIAADYNLPLDAVEEAIAYCQTDPPEIKQDFDREERIMEATGMNEPDYKYGGKYRVLAPQERTAWTMKIYLDEDLASGLLAKLLQKAGHDISTPAASGTLARADAVQLTCSIHEQRACLSRNYADFEELHLLIAEAKGHHFGILVVRRENDPTRDLTPKGIVAAFRKLEAAGVPTHNEYIVLNQWR